MTFSLCSVIVRGYKKALVREDLWSLNPGDVSHVILSKFDNYWDPEVTKYLRYGSVSSFRRFVEPQGNGEGGFGHRKLGNICLSLIIKKTQSIS